MWPRDAYVGQRVTAVKNITCRETGESLSVCRIYTIESICDYCNIVSFFLKELPESIVSFWLLRPVDESRLDMFRRNKDLIDA